MSAPELLTPSARALAAGPRLLLLSHHFPPGQAAGALRWEKLAAHAAERGWGLDVVTVHPRSLRAPDFSRLAGLPEGTRVWGVPVPRDRFGEMEEAAAALVRRVASGRAGRAAGGKGAADVSPSPEAPPALEADAELAWRRDLRWSATPAAARRALAAWRAFAGEARWARAAAEAARAVAERGRHAAVVTCGPPHMVHVAGARMARRAGLPLVLDLRDPWSLAPAVHRDVGSPLWYALAARHERRAVREAALVACNTAVLAEAMGRAHPGAAERIVTVMNGCDDERLPPRREEGRFVVAYAGSIYIDRDPRPFLRAAARVAREEDASPERFSLEFVGHADAFGGVPLLELARRAGVERHVRVHARLPRAQALALLAGASVLLSLPQGVDLAIPSKLFEYLQLPAWVLALAARGSATERLLRGSGADVVDPGDEEAIAAALRERWRRWARGERPRPLNADGRFGRRRQADVLFDALEARLGAAPAAPRGRAA